MERTKCYDFSIDSKCNFYCWQKGDKGSDGFVLVRGVGLVSLLLISLLVTNGGSLVNLDGVWTW